MRIQILGTAAAEGWPGIFCGCKTCTRAREVGGKNLRSRASLQINDIYKIDLPPDTYYHCIRFGLNLSQLKYLFYTHSHGDHFAPHEIEYTRPSFAHELKNAPIRIYANAKVISAIKATCERHELPVRLQVAEPFIPIQADNLTFIPILAEHAPNEQSLNYVIQSDNATVLYASDTGEYGKQTMDFLYGLKFNALIVECTYGPKILVPASTHMHLKAVRNLKDNLTRANAVSSSTRTILTHFSHNMGLLHDEMEERVVKYGMEVAYDGMVIEL